MIPRRLAATVAVIALLTLGACQKKESEDPRRRNPKLRTQQREAAATLPAEPPRRSPTRSATPTSARRTSTRAGRSTLGSSGTASPIPADAYKYFKGEPIKHPLGYEIKIDTPLDWAGVTDHSEYVGVIKLANDPELAGQQAARRAAADHEGRRRQEEMAADLHLRRQGADGRAAGQGADGPGDRRHGLEGERRARRAGQRAAGSSRRSAPTSGPRCRTT